MQCWPSTALTFDNTINPTCSTRMQAKLVEAGAKSHAEATEEFYHAERDHTKAQHTVEEIEVCHAHILCSCADLIVVVLGSCAKEAQRR